MLGLGEEGELTGAQPRLVSGLEAEIEMIATLQEDHVERLSFRADRALDNIPK